MIRIPQAECRAQNSLWHNIWIVSFCSNSMCKNFNVGHKLTVHKLTDIIETSQLRLYATAH